MTKRLKTFGVLIAAAALAAGCAAGKAFRLAEAATKAGDLDQAVVYYRQAAQEDPNNANYKIALQRASLAASRAHLDKARDFESKDQLEAAVSEYRLASEYDPTNRLAANKVAAIERTLRERAEAARPKPAIQGMRERARASSEPALINLNQVLPLIRFNNASLRDVLTAIAGATGINVTYDRDVAGSSGHRAARRRHAGAGAEPADDDEPAVVQGDQRPDDLRFPGRAAETHPVRRPGRADVLPVAHRCD